MAAVVRVRGGEMSGEALTMWDMVMGPDGALYISAHFEATEEDLSKVRLLFGVYLDRLDWNVPSKCISYSYF